MSIRLARESDADDLYAVCLGTGSDGSDATDLYDDPRLLGEVFVGPYLRHSPELAWVYGIVRNVVGNEYRRVERAGALARRLLPAPIVDSTSSTHRVLEVRRTLLSLRPADRELLFMAYWEDLTPAEMAAILGCTLATLAVRLNRARAAFRRRLPDPVPLAAREVTSLG